MKFVIILVILLVVLLGGAYGLAKIHVLPVAGIAKSSPMAKTLLTKLHLMPPVRKKLQFAASTTAAPPTTDPLAAQKQQLADEQAQVDIEKTQLDKKLAAASSQPAAPAIIQTAPQLVDIYEAMGADDLAALFAKEPDSTVVSALIAMDTKKAAKALAAMPPDRQVKITALMNRAMATASNIPQPTTP